MTREDFLYKSHKSHNNKFTYPDFDNYSDSNIKVPIVCPNHGLFHQNPFDHIKGIGCRICFFDSLKTWTDDDDKLLIENFIN